MNVFGEIYGNYRSMPEQDRGAPTGVFGAAMRQTNDVTNLLDYLSRDEFEPDPTFDPRKHFDPKTMPSDWRIPLARSNSLPDFQARLGRLQREQRDMETLAAAGGLGTATALATGMLSPTIFLPFAGEAQGAARMAQILALGAAGGSASEFPLWANQENRTAEEMAGGVALQTVFAGMLGKAFDGLTAAERVALQMQFEAKQGKVLVPEIGADGRVTLREVDDTQAVGEGGMAPLPGNATIPDSPRLYRYERSSYEVDDGAIHYSPSKTYAENYASPERILRETVVPQDVLDIRVPTEADIATAWLREEAARYAEAADNGRISVGADLADLQKVLAAAQLSPEGIARAFSLLDWISGRNLDHVPVGAAQKRFLGAVDRPAMTMRESDGSVSYAFRSVDDVPELPGRGGKEAAAIGAAPSRTRNTLGPQRATGFGAAAKNTLMDALGSIHPTYRMFTNRMSAALRNAAPILDSAGLRQAGLETMEPSQMGASIQSRLRIHDAVVVKFAQTLDKGYHKYLYPDQAYEPSSLGAAWEQVKSSVNMQPAGKMTYSEWKAQIYDDLSTGTKRPETAELVGAFRDFFAYYNGVHKEYLAELRARGIDARPLYKELDEKSLGTDVVEYAHQIYSLRKIEADVAGFVGDVTDHLERNLKGEFAANKKRMMKRRAQLQRDIAFAYLDAKAKALGLADAEATLEFIDELPEVVGVNLEIKELKAQAAEEGWSPEQLKAQIKDVQKNAGAEYKEAMRWRKETMDHRRRMKALGGNALAEIEKQRAIIADMDKKLEAMFRHDIPAIAKIDLSVGRTQAESDKAIASLVPKLEKALELLDRRQQAYAKTFGKGSVYFEKRADDLRRATERVADARKRLDVVKGQQLSRDEKLSELAMLREFAVQDAARLARARGAKAAAAEEKLAEAEAKVLSDEERAALVASMQQRLSTLETDFDLAWRDKGARGADFLGAEPDFRETAYELATHFYQKVKGADELTPATFLARQSERGPQLMRAMSMPYEVKQKWLEKDVELVSRAFDRQMAPDLEIWRAFDGSVNGQTVLDELGQELHDLTLAATTSSYVRLPKGMLKLAGEGKVPGKGVVAWMQRQAEAVRNRLSPEADINQLAFSLDSFRNDAAEGFVELTPELRQSILTFMEAQAKSGAEDFAIAIQRLRNTRMAPKDASALGYRAGTFVKNLNVSTMMGSVVPSSLPDLAMPIFRYGVNNTVRKAWAPFVRNLRSQSGKTFRMASAEVNRRIALNIETATHGRAQSMLDLAEPDARGRTVLERTNKFLAQKTGLVALFDVWTDQMKGLAGAMTHATLAEYIPAVAAKIEELGPNAALTGDELAMRTYLRELGLRDLDVLNIGRQMAQQDGMEVFPNGGRLPNFDRWQDTAAFRAYAAAVQQDVNRMVLTPGLERPNIVDENIAWSLFWQFQSFGMAANSRILIAGLQGNQPYALQGVFSSLALGAVSYYAYAYSVGGTTLAKAEKMEPDDWIYQAVDRSGLMGALSYPWRIAEQVPMLNQYAAFGGEDQAYRRPLGLMGAIAGPSYGKAAKMAEVVVSWDDPERTERNLHSLRQIYVPYQNHFLLRQQFDAMEAGLLSTVGKEN